MLVSTPDLCDAHENDVMVLDCAFRNFGGNKAFGGMVVTVKCFEDNSLVKEQLGMPGDGRVLVVDGGGSLRRALLGDMIAESATRNGWSGVVIYGAVRDVDAIAALHLGVQALGSVPLKTEKRGIGDLNIPVRFGGVTIRPGYYLYADNNGVIVSEHALT
ncbi:MAG TPA: ribonuclease E activity regulator RraA [Pseudomonadales bacterium]|nr:ribonuclease E activity regulator RraA [Pseudomonadales bacterium]